jgi:hypothetical protein
MPGHDREKIKHPAMSDGSVAAAGACLGAAIPAPSALNAAKGRWHASNGRVVDGAPSD